jgi:Fe-S oxidoreductase
MIPSRVVSIAWLGWRFVVVQPLRKLLPGPSAKARFAEAYFGEGCVPTAVADREVALAASACTGCGLCEVRCPLRAALPPPVAAMGLQSIFRLHSKHLGEAREGAALLAACADCESCDDACPAGVPIARVVRRLAEIAAASAARPIARRVT